MTPSAEDFAGNADSRDRIAWRFLSLICFSLYSELTILLSYEYLADSL
jgi:hypothetical protein